MKKSFDISGMHCESCIEKIKNALESNEGVVSAEVSLNPPRAIVNLKSEVPFEKLRGSVKKAGKYDLKKQQKESQTSLRTLEVKQDEGKSLYPLFLIVGFIAAVVLAAGAASSSFNLSWLMQQFMAGFFITFSFFKLLDLEGFVSAFRGYDLIARRYPVYGWSYPFIELALGFSYLTGVLLVPAYIATILVMGVGAIGVLKVLLNKSSIQCACLGTVLNLPMTKITLIENTSMVVMAVAMLVM